MSLHVQQVSQASSIAEHDLSDLVAESSPTAAATTTRRPAGIIHQGIRANRTVNSHDGIIQPPRAISYASPSSSVGHASSSYNGSSGAASATEYHPASLIPTVSPPRYQLSLSHPGSPPGRAFASRSGQATAGHHCLPQSRQGPDGDISSYDPAVSPSLSLTSAPTVLQSFPSWSQTWQSGGVSVDGRGFTSHIPSHDMMDGRLYSSYRHPGQARAVSNPEIVPGSTRPALYPQGWLPEYDEATDGESITPLTAEQQARITGDQYRLGVGYDDAVGGGGSAASGGKGGKHISEERRLERLYALEKEFGRAKRSTSFPGVGEAGALTSPELASNDKSKKGRPAKYMPKDGDSPNHDETDPEKMTFKQLRAKQKEERKRINKQLGVTKTGNLITQGSGRRKMLRWTQAILGLIAVFSGIGGAIFTHPKKDESPPPSGAISTWFLYLISVASLICSTYLFAIKPCLRRSKAKNSADVTGAASAAGGMVLPIFASSSHDYNALSGGGKKQKKKGRGKTKYGMQHQQPMTVNLVVDPSMLGLGPKPPSRYDDSGFDEAEEEEALRREAAHLDGVDENGDEHEHDHDFDIPDTSRLEAKRREQILGRATGGGLGGMLDTMSAMRLQDKWREARRRMRWMAWIDAAWAVIWYAESLFAIGFGKSCKPGSASGWCDTYNLALASGVLLAVAFTISCVLDCLDLRRSRSVPRISRGMAY